MNPADAVTPQLVNYCKNSVKTIAIVGYTKTGKVTIARKLAEELGYKLYISDEYINEEDVVGSLYTLMDAVLEDYTKKTPIIVEGILVYRLLRKGMQLGNFTPDLIIQTKCNAKTIKHFYNKDGEGHKYSNAMKFNKGLDKIWKDYLELVNENQPTVPVPGYLTIETSLQEYR